MQGSGAPPPHSQYPQQQPYPQQPYPQQPYPQPYPQQHQSPTYLQGQKLVSLSRWLLLGGCVLMFGGCGGGIALQFAPLAAGGSILGMLIIIVAAVVGSVGRGMQGRVI